MGMPKHIFVMLLIAFVLGMCHTTPFQPINNFIPIVDLKKIVKKIPIPFADREVDCMAKNVYYESRGENALGQLAVAQVTYNRHIAHKQTICQVVYRPAQFSWTADNTISPPSLKSATWLRAKEIANDVLFQGKRCEEVGNAMYFHAIQVAPEWMHRKKRVTQIGNHIFYEEA